MSLFFRNSLDIEIKFDGEDKRQIVEFQPWNQAARELAPLFSREESVKGSVTLRPRDSRKVEHSGVKCQFIGSIEQPTDRGQHDDFIAWTQELAAPGEIRHAETFPFEFRNVEKQFESYSGRRVRLRYFVRVIVFSKLNDVVRERDLWVYRYEPEGTAETSLVNMDVGIEDCLHIEFEYAKSRLDLADTIVGRIYFMLVRLKLKYMELSLVRKEIVGTAPNHQTDTEPVVRFEIMDGAPVRGEQIPIRLYLGGFDLVPTMRDVNKKFSVRTFLSLVLVDEAGRRYFKQSEITLYRKEPDLSDS